MGGYNENLPPPANDPTVPRLLLVFCAMFYAVPPILGADFDRDMKPLLVKYCAECHSGEAANGGVDFQQLAKSSADIDAAYEVWESVAQHLVNRTMPPDDSPQPTDEQRSRALAWYKTFVGSIKARPAVFRPRRLSVIEYRNTLNSVMGFELQATVNEAEQTETERSLAVKLLPIDPPGASGFTNDTHGNPLSMVAWEQYAYLADAALIELFSPHRREDLEVFTGKINGQLQPEQASEMVRRFLPLVYRRDAPQADVDEVVARLDQLEGDDLVAALKFELKAALVSPSFLYRGFLVEGKRGTQQPVDAFELAERLSYFFWADMPDAELFACAADGSLNDPVVYAAQIDRLLASPKSRRLADVFVSQWLTLSEIDVASDNPPIRVAWKSQPLDFMHFLFTQDRPLLEMIDSDVAFISPHTSRMYGADAKQMKKYKRGKGIEIEIVKNQQIRLEHASERGGVLTMPGILAMNRGPILRGTWMLERILGDHLPDPPANVGQVSPNRKGESLTFRERFQQHRANEACAVCHDKIDPLGFALQTFDSNGQYMLASNYKKTGKQKKAGKSVDPSQIDTTGKLPSGQTFADIAELKQALLTSEHEAVIRNIVQRTMAYALCRKLELFDRPTVDEITRKMNTDGATWRDLFHAIAGSLPFRETILSKPALN